MSTDCLTRNVTINALKRFRESRVLQGDRSYNRVDPINQRCLWGKRTVGLRRQTIFHSPAQAEGQALRDKRKDLAYEFRTLAAMVHALRKT